MSLLKEYDTNTVDVAEGLPWGGLTMPFVMQQKEGSCFSVIEYSPYEKDLLSKPLKTPAFCRGWGIWSEHQHTPDTDRHFFVLFWNPFTEKHHPQILNTLIAAFLPCRPFGARTRNSLPSIPSAFTSRIFLGQRMLRH